MVATIIKWIVVVLAAMNFGYMAFDGGRALVKGDYIRPRSGTYAGQLGAWSKLVAKFGINPESTTMKIIFLAWGVIGLALTVCFILKMPWSTNALIAINVLSLWYLVPGSISSSVQIILLVIRKFII